MDEKRIIRNILNGDTEQYADLVERYHIGLIIYCERLIGDRMEAEDIAQQSFIKAYNKLDTFQPDRGRFSTWLYKIAANQAIDFLRKRKRLIVSNAIEDTEPTIPDFLTDELLHDVRSAVLALMPPEHRLAIEAYYWKGKSCQAIADEMGVPLNTIKSWLRRAKAQLREALA